MLRNAFIFHMIVLFLNLRHSCCFVLNSNCEMKANDHLVIWSRFIVGNVSIWGVNSCLPRRFMSIGQIDFSHYGQHSACSLKWTAMLKRKERANEKGMTAHTALGHCTEWNRNRWKCKICIQAATASGCALPPAIICTEKWFLPFCLSYITHKD